MPETSENRLQSAEVQKEEETLENTLRPQKLVDFIGQNSIKTNLEITLEAARIRKEPIDHVLLYGPPGLGKTTLAHIIAHETGHFIHSTSGPAIERAGDLAALLTNLQEGDILFIDEIHRLHKTIEEILYPAMEDYKLDIIVGKGPTARTLKLDLSKFTLIGATTRLSALSSPLRDRFGIVHRLTFYEDVHIEEIIARTARILTVAIHQEAARELSKRSRKTPRIANRLLKRVRDYCLVKGDGNVSEEDTHKALDMMEIDTRGLDETDRKLLQVIIDNFNGGPVGLGTVAAALSEEEDTIAEIYEPFLMQIGFLERTSRGRSVTQRAYEHLDIDKD